VSIRGFDSVRPFQLPEPGSLRLPWAIFCRAFSPFGLSLVTSAATAVIRVHSSSFVVRRFPPQSRNLFRPYRAWELLNHATQGVGRRLALPWAIIFRAFGPLGLSLVTSAATAVIRVHSRSFVALHLPTQSRNFFRPYRAWELLNHATQGAARRLALPWAILCRAFSPFGLSLVSSAATAVIRAGRPLMCGAEAKESSTPHPSPLLVRGGEGGGGCAPHP